MDRSKKPPAHFFENANGGEAVREWLLELPLEDRKLIGRDIQKVEFGWPLGLPYCSNMGDGLWEVRSSLAGGRIARVLFCIANGQMVLLHGFLKKSQKTPARELNLARKRMKELKLHVH